MWKQTISCLLLAALATAQQPPRRQQAEPATGAASIAGRVLDSTGAPVRRAVVTVEGESRSQRTAKSITGDDGSFLVRELPKGKYWIIAEKTGYLRGSYRGRSATGYGDPVELKDDTAKSGVDIVLPRQGVIAGRVVDEWGEPAERVFVFAVPVRSGGSRAGAASTASTNDLGEFRLSKLSPGNYLLLATRGGGGMEPIVDRQPGKPATAEAPTYFPGALDAASATAIRVNAGEERTGAEIRLQRSTVVTVAGRVTGDLPAERRARVAIRSSNDAAGFRGGMVGGGPMGGAPQSDGGIRPDGTFSFRNIRPGEYTLSVVAMDRGGPKILGKQTLMVGQQDVLNVTLTAAAAPNVEGRLRADTEPPFAIGSAQISLRPAAGGGGGFGGPPVSVKAGANGAFTLSAVSRERQVVQVEGAGEGIVVKSISAGGQPLPGLDVDFSVVSGPLEILLTNKPAKISGTLEGVAADAPRVAVWAVPDAQPLTVESWNRRKIKVEASAGTFSFDSLRPGSYRLAACEDADSDALNDASVWERVKNRTTTVKVAEGETGQVTLRVIPARELDEL